MRHIPEAELHAYLDQALSRTQCVEIERHLAACTVCQLARDEIAALRDRTTALLASLSPVTHAPPFDVIRSRTAGALSARRRQRQRIIWAASVLGGIGLGWAAATVFRTEYTATVASTGVPSAKVTPADSVHARPAPVPTAAARIASSPTASATRQGQAVNVAVSDSAIATEPAPVPTAPSWQDVAAASPGRDSASTSPASGPIASSPTGPNRSGGVMDSAHPAGDLVLSGAWQKVSWAGAQAQAGGKAPPHIDGLPVVDVQVQKNEPGERPTMVVAQQLASGEVIRTIEGPAADVSRLLGHRTMTDPVPDSITRSAATPTAGGARGGMGQSMALQRGDRMVAITGALSSDSLRAMMLRLHGGQGEQEPGPAPTVPNAPTNGNARGDQSVPAQPNLSVPPLIPTPQQK